MTHTITSICNSALNKLGKPPLVVDADGGAAQEYDAAAAVVQAYGERIGRVLRSHPWNFAETNVVLDADASAPDGGYAYAFTLPSDCAKFWKLDEAFHGKDPDVRVRGTTLLTNIAGPLYAIYTKRVEDPALFDDEFAEALADEVADKAALRVLGSVESARIFRAQAKEAQAEARSSDAKENRAQEIDGGSWLVGRSTG